MANVRVRNNHTAALGTIAPKSEGTVPDWVADQFDFLQVLGPERKGPIAAVLYEIIDASEDEAEIREHLDDHRSTVRDRAERRLRQLGLSEDEDEDEDA